MFRTRVSLFAASALTVLASLPAPPAAAAAVTVRFDIAAGRLEDALMTYANQAGRQIVVDPQLIAGRTTPAVKGAYPPAAVLDRLLAGTGLIVRQTGPNAFVVRAAGLTAANPDRRADLQPVAFAGAQVTPDPMQAVRTDSPATAPATVLEEVVITGTLIRGAPAGASPVVQFDRKTIDEQGHATVADMLAHIPQNFGGAGTAASAVLGTDGRGTNDLAASGVNLRGLGPAATLVLVNGRRLAGAGTKGDFADASAIPTAIIDRVDVLLDGASALYGSDAVGGVVNVVLKRRLEGAETRLRIGTSTRGGAEELQASQAFGASWQGGELLVAYEFGKRWGLKGSERDTTASADLRAFGGTDRRVFYAHPGNILVFNSATGAYASAWAIPTGQSGVGLRPGDFIAGAVNLGNQRQGGDVIPAEERHNLYVSLSQELGDRLRLLGDVRYNRRDNQIARPPSLSVFTVTAANPYFVSPNGSTSHAIGYSFGDEVGATQSAGRAESLGVSLGGEFDLGRGWRGDVFGALAMERGRRDSERVINSRFLNEALGAIADDPNTRYRAAVDGYFNPFGAFGANSPAVIDFIGSGYTRGRTYSQVLTLDAKADGPLWTLPAGEVKAAIGVQSRQERFKQSATNLISSALPSRTGGLTFRRKVEAAFLEVRVPILDAAAQVPLVHSLELSAAGRIERYGDFGRTRNPKFGLVWAPTPDLKLRASYGTSFRAPNMPELYQLQSSSPVLVGPAGSQTLILLHTGGNRDLQPESARSWSFGFDYAPEAISGLKLSATWFDVAFEDQIGQPVSGDTANALTNPAYAPFVTRITPGDADQLARVKAIMAISTNANINLFPPEAYRAIVDARFVNTGEVVVRGLDLQAAYGWSLGANDFDLDASVSYLVDFKRRFTPSAAPVQQLDTANQPVDLRARLSGTWSRGPYALSAALNYVDDYKSETSRKIEAWTPVDLQARWTPAASGALDGLSLILSVQNLFDEDPPFYDNPLGLAYDPANADPIGRTVALQLTKRW